MTRVTGSVLALVVSVWAGMIAGGVHAQPVPPKSQTAVQMTLRTNGKVLNTKGIKKDHTYQPRAA